MYSVASTTRRDNRQYIQCRLKKLDEWSRKPMSSRAECAVAAASGAVMFLAFFFAAGLA